MRRAAGPVSALSFFLNSASAPELVGSSTYNFDDQADDTFFTSTTVFGGELTINANNGQLWFDDQRGASFGTTGIVLDTNNNVANDFEFLFTTETYAFGFAVNALDVDWTMEIFDTSDVLINTFAIPNQVALGGFLRQGFAGAYSDTAIKRVRVFTAGGSDRALIDDFQIVAVPEPGSASMVWIGLLGLAVFGSPRERREHWLSQTRRPFKRCSKGQLRAPEPAPNSPLHNSEFHAYADALRNVPARGLNMDDAQRLHTGDAWHDFCDRLKSVGDHIRSDSYSSEPRDRAEGYRYLTRMLSYAMRMEIECGDAEFPQLCRYENPYDQWGGPNPDNTYLRCAIHPDHEYRVWGNLAGMRQIIISLQEGDMQLKQYGVYSEQGLDDWKVGPDGEWEMIISSVKPEGDVNWMPMHELARMFQVRIYLSDWVNDTSPTLHIERIGGEGVAPPPPDPAKLAASLDRTANWVAESADYWNVYTRKSFARATPNEVGRAGSTPGGADNIKYGTCFWDLAEDDALVIVCDEPQAQYYNFCIHTLDWLESGDYANRQVSLAGHQLHKDEDGKLRIVLSAKDPGVPNWIDTEGRQQGLFVFRFVWATTNPEPSGEVIKVGDVRSRMPEGHPVIDAAERRRRLSARREQFWNRNL